MKEKLLKVTIEIDPKSDLAKVNEDKLQKDPNGGFFEIVDDDEDSVYMDADKHCKTAEDALKTQEERDASMNELRVIRIL